MDGHMVSLGIHWTTEESRNYIDILPMTLFDSEVQDKEVEHSIRRPNGTVFNVKSNVDVNGSVATLTYRQTNNRLNSIWPGITRITFETNERKQIRGIEWQDEGDTEFIDPRPILFFEDDQAHALRFFVIKSDQVEISGESLSLSGHAIESMNGNDISLGDRAFVWVFENQGGRGIEWCGVVQNLGEIDSGVYKIALDNLHRTTSNFGTRDIDKFRNSSSAEEMGLFIKLKGYSQAGIRQINQGEAEILLSLFFLDAFANDGQHEIARLIQLGTIASRPNQAAFSSNVRRAYEGKCAFTACTTSEALEAAHIKVAEGRDDNDLQNGILLRADIHALFDKGLIALTLDGSRVELNKMLSDPSYGFLRTAEVSQPQGCRLLEANIRHHRLRFGFPCP
jgi:hypothetical protein